MGVHGVQERMQNAPDIAKIKPPGECGVHGIVLQHIKLRVQTTVQTVPVKSQLG